MSRHRRGAPDQVVAEVCEALYTDGRLRALVNEAVSRHESVGPDADAYAAAVALSLTPVLRRLAADYITHGERVQRQSLRRQVADMLGMSRQSLDAAIPNEIGTIRPGPELGAHPGPPPRV